MANSSPAEPSLEQLRKQAKEFRDLVRTGHPKFTEMVLAWHPRPPMAWAGFTLADAQLTVARSYGFASWAKLRAHLGVVARYCGSPHRQTDAGGPVCEFLRLACLTYRIGWRARPGEQVDDAGRTARAAEMLAAQPDLASADIYTAAAVGNVTAARALLAADPTLANREGGPHGWPPLLYLTFCRVPEVESTLEAARLLLAHGADPNAGFLPDGEPPPVTALSGAFKGQRDPVNQPPHEHGLRLARLLLEAGADPHDEQALANAGRYPHEGDAHLELFLSHGLGRGDGGPWRARLGHRAMSPHELVRDELNYAAEMGLMDRVRLLLPRCADPGADLGADLDEAYCRAKRNEHTEIAGLLRRAGARPCAADEAWPTPLIRAAMFGRADAVRRLVADGAALNDDPRGSALHIAALTGDLELARLLIELGADHRAEAIDDTPGQFAPPDRTPLGWARYLRRDDVAEYLAALRKGAEEAPRKR